MHVRVAYSRVDFTGTLSDICYMYLVILEVRRQTQGLFYFMFLSSLGSRFNICELDHSASEPFIRGMLITHSGVCQVIVSTCRCLDRLRNLMRVYIFVCVCPSPTLKVHSVL